MSIKRIDEFTAATSVPAGAAFLLEITPDTPATRAYRRATAALLGVVEPLTTTATGNQDAFDPTGARVVFCANATLLTLRGILAGFHGQLLTFISKAAGQVDLANQHATPAAADRIINQVTGTISLAAGSGRVTLVYDATTARWRVLEHEQGAWITPTFAAGDFTANGAMTWTVAAGDVTTFAYRLSGRTLFVDFRVGTTTIAGTLNNALQILIPGGFVAAKAVRTIYDRERVGANSAATLLEIAAAATLIVLRYDTSSANFEAGTDTVLVAGCVAFEVQ